MVPGEYILQDGVVELNAGREAVERCASPTPAIAPSRSARTRISSRSTRRCSSIASTAYGRRLDVPAGTSLRFEPGEARDVTLIPLAGRRVAYGMNALVNGPPRTPTGHEDSRATPTRASMARRRAIASAWRTRTSSCTSSATSPTYGEEVTFGGGKVIRDGQGQSQVSRADGAPDLVITNVIVLDYWGVVKADVGVRDGRICAIGKAGNPDIQDGVTPGLAIGPSTEIIAGEHRILTAGGIDAHIHFISPQQVWEALYSGVTTMIGGGTGPAEGTRATTCTPGRVAHPPDDRSDAGACR